MSSRGAERYWSRDRLGFYRVIFEQCNFPVECEADLKFRATILITITKSYVEFDFISDTYGDIRPRNLCV